MAVTRSLFSEEGFGSSGPDRAAVNGRKQDTAKWTQLPPVGLESNNNGYWVQKAHQGLALHDVKPVSAEDEGEGLFGASTFASVLDFQHKHGIPCTGVVNAATWAALLGRHEVLRSEVLDPLSWHGCYQEYVDPGSGLPVHEDPLDTLHEMTIGCSSLAWVGRLQAMLLSAGFRMDERELASCSLGPSTWAAILAFQEECPGLEPTGRLDVSTWTALTEGAHSTGAHAEGGEAGHGEEDDEVSVEAEMHALRQQRQQLRKLRLQQSRMQQQQQSSHSNSFMHPHPHPHRGQPDSSGNGSAGGAVTPHPEAEEVLEELRPRSQPLSQPGAVTAKLGLQHPQGLSYEQLEGLVGLDQSQQPQQMGEAVTAAVEGQVAEMVAGSVAEAEEQHGEEHLASQLSQPEDAVLQGELLPAEDAHAQHETAPSAAGYEAGYDEEEAGLEGPGLVEVWEGQGSNEWAPPPQEWLAAHGQQAEDSQQPVSASSPPMQAHQQYSAWQYNQQEQEVCDTGPSYAAPSSSLNEPLQYSCQEQYSGEQYNYQEQYSSAQYRYEQGQGSQFADQEGFYPAQPELVHDGPSEQGAGFAGLDGTPEQAEQLHLHAQLLESDDVDTQGEAEGLQGFPDGYYPFQAAAAAAAQASPSSHPLAWGEGGAEVSALEDAASMQGTPMDASMWGGSSSSTDDAGSAPTCRRGGRGVGRKGSPHGGRSGGAVTAVVVEEGHAAAAASAAPGAAASPRSSKGSRRAGGMGQQQQEGALVPVVTQQRAVQRLKGRRLPVWDVSLPEVRIGRGAPFFCDLVHVALQRKGFFPPGLEFRNSRFGPGSEAALLAFQVSAGLPPTGAVDPPTWAALLRHLPDLQSRAYGAVFRAQGHAGLLNNGGQQGKGGQGRGGQGGSSGQ